MTNEEILKVLESLEGFKYRNVYTEEQIEKDRNSLNKLKEQLTIHSVRDSFFALYPYNGKAHFGKSKNRTFCGMDVPDVMNKPLQVKIENKELMELWNEDCDVQEKKWVRVSKYYKCKSCLKALEKNYL